MLKTYSKRKSGGALLLLAFAALSPTLLQGSHANAAPTPATEAAAPEKAHTIAHTIKSQYPAMDRHLSVSLPKGYNAKTDSRYPVLYILDSETNLDFTRAVVNFLGDNGQIPAMIVVGIHADGTRDVDYLPKSTDPAAAGQSGDAGQFLIALENEIIPLVQKSYRATDFRLISGHSYGGLFVSYAMTQNPDLFQGYFTQSPYFSAVTTPPSLERFKAVFEKHPDMQSHFFMTLGDENLLAEGYKAVADFLAANAPKTVQIVDHPQPGRTHMQTRMLGTYAALEQYFAKDWGLNAAAESGDIAAHMAGLKAKYGTAPQYDVETFAQAMQALLQGGKVPQGTAMGEIFVEQHPNSAFAHFFLFNAYAMGGNKDGALKQVNAALKIIDETPEPSAEMQQIYPQLKQMQQRLGG